MNNRILMIVLLLLLGIYGLTKMFSGNKDNSFKTELIQIDTTEITTITINPKDPNVGEFTLKKEEGKWIASNGSINVNATPSAVSSLLNGLATINTKRIAANNPEKWPEYEVDEGNGTRVKVYEKENLIEEFIVGRFNFNQQTRTAISFIRLAGENEVYAVDGFQTMTFGQPFDGYRDKVLMKMTPEMTINSFAYNFPDTTLVFQRRNGDWFTEGNLPLDSMKVESYLNVFRNISGSNFADDFDDSIAENYEQYGLTLSGDNFPMPYQVTVYRDTTREMPFIIYSNQNQDTYFASDSTGLFGKLFKPVVEMVSIVDREQ